MKKQYKDEEFKHYPEDNMYLVSNYGRVYSKKSGKFLKGNLKKTGYIEFTFWVNEARKYERANRLVALLFCDKPEGATVVNHLDMNKANNYYKNLEWTTISGNTQHWYDNDPQASVLQRAASEAGAKATRQIIDIYLHGEFVSRHVGQLVAAKAIGKDRKTIYNCIRENRATRDGYTFILVGTEAEVI